MNNRQINIILDLENTQYPITSAALAKKYDVSLRTIRNDVVVIDDYLKGIDGVIFIKKARYGLRIISEKSIAALLKNETTEKDFIYFDVNERHLLMLLCFILGEQPITLDYLSEFFDVSKGTIIKEIQLVKEWLNNTKVKLKGVKNKGYYLDCSNYDVFSLITSTFSTIDVNRFNAILFSNKSLFFDDEEKEKMNVFSLFLEKEINCSYVNRFMVNLLCGFLVKNNTRIKKEETSFLEMEKGSKIQKVVEFFKQDLGIYIDAEEFAICKLILANYTDFSEDIISYKDLGLVIDKMLDNVAKEYAEININREILRIDLIRHISSLLERRKLNLVNVNPLLSQIKARYFDVFKTAQKAAKVFEEYYHIQLTEDEIGFITLYYCRSIEKTYELKDAKVLVVCNTGRGASKLLAARIMNNFPQLHIIAMCSYDEVKYRTDLLELVDIVISTIAIKEISKPCIVVSPFLSELELFKISEMIWINSHSYGQKLDNEQLEATVKAAVNNYQKNSSKNIEAYLDVPHIDNTYADSAFNNEIYAEIIVCAMDMIFKVYPGGLYNEQYSIVSGILSHIIMAVPRWKNGSFIQVSNYDELREKYMYEFEIIMGFLHDCEKILSIFIDPCEAIAILRYLTY